MKFQPGVNPVASFPIGYALGVADSLHREMFGTELEVTSIKDNKHKNGSLHRQDKPEWVEADAADIRTRHMDDGQRAIFHRELQARLEPHGFDVVDEGDHIHIEFDPKPGEMLYGRAAD